jgi:tRNA pseudouridine38-40 synthase
MARNLKLTLEYDGTDYAGWQAQTNALAIQTVVERALEDILGESTRIIGAGRTDAGVHATGQVASFRTENLIPTEGLLVALNNALPRDVAVLHVADAPERFHARFDARWRTYRYTILNRATPSALRARYVWHCRRTIPVAVWHALCQEVVGQRDFSSLQKTGSSRTSPICTVVDCRCWNEGELVVVSITANSFLRGMVRALVGTLARLAPDESTDPDAARRNMQAILGLRDRQAAGESAPPQGLCLTEVAY